MDLILSDEQRLLSDSAGKLFDRLGGPKRARTWRGTEAGFDPKMLQEMGASGWLSVLVPEAHGGLGLGPCELALVLQQCGRALAPEPVAEAALGALLLAQGEGGQAGAALLEAAMAGEAVLMPAVLDDRGDMTCEGLAAAGAGAALRLTGSRNFVVAASAAAGFLVGAQAADGPVLCHVPRGAAGLQVSLSPTVEGRSYGRLRFDGVKVEDVLAVGDAAAAALRRHHDLALVAASAELLGVMEGASALTLDYLKTRKQFGRAIGSFQALQHRAVDSYVLIESTRSLLYQACAGGEPSTSVAAALKAFASGAALTVAKTAIQLHGAIGFTDEHDAGLFLKRAMWLSAHYGNEAAQRRRFAALSG